jgi:hypothetical protein
MPSSARRSVGDDGPESFAGEAFVFGVEATDITAREVGIPATATTLKVRAPRALARSRSALSSHA